jgi:hypothetical protein
MRAARPALLAALLACVGGGAAAHDSWLEPGARPGELRFVTGPHYPVAESAPALASVSARGCVDAKGRTRPLPHAASAAASGLVLRAPTVAAVSCWAELAPHDIVLEPSLVDIYFREIQPPEGVRQAWAGQQERGIAWRERYRKSARIEVTRGDETPEALRQLRRPRGLALEVVIADDEAVRVGRPTRFQVLADGQPVPGFSVQLVSERSRLGVWARTDAQGHVSHVLPFAGRWAMRGTLLEPEGDDRWQSRFVTLVFDAR